MEVRCLELTVGEVKDYHIKLAKGETPLEHVFHGFYSLVKHKKNSTKKCRDCRECDCRSLSYAI